MALAAKLISIPAPNLAEISSSLGLIGVEPSISVMADTILPPQLSRGALSRGLQHSSRTVRHASATVLSLALNRLGDIQNRLRDLEYSQSQLEGASEEGWGLRMARELRDDVQRRIPDIQIIISFHGSVGKVNDNAPASKLDDENESGLDVGLNPSETKLINASDNVDEDENITSDVMIVTSLGLIRGYQKYFPDTLLESRFDHGKLLPAKCVVSDDLPKTFMASVEFQTELLNLLLEVPNFKWWNRAG